MQNIWWTMKITTNTMTNEIWHDLKPIFVCYITININRGCTQIRYISRHCWDTTELILIITRSRIIFDENPVMLKWSHMCSARKLFQTSSNCFFLDVVKLISKMSWEELPNSVPNRRESLVMFTNCDSSIKAVFSNRYKTPGTIICITKYKRLRQISMKTIQINLIWKYAVMISQTPRQ